MKKYAPLQSHFATGSQRDVVLSFREIESILGSKLPAKAEKRHWWQQKAPPTAHDQRMAWQPVGYAAVLLAGRKVRFSRTALGD